ncbi:hypothetical protein GLOIN_2v1554207, partial [Rhizophagus irregularis DAOM 181602=DAOM 197198]
VTVRFPECPLFPEYIFSRSHLPECQFSELNIFLKYTISRILISRILFPEV